MAKKPVKVERDKWASHEQNWHGAFEGKSIGADVTVLFYTTDEIGKGPPWHIHPYDEVFIVRTGHALFTVGTEKIEAAAGEIVFGPAGIPHKFVNLGPGRLETTDIHLSDRWIQTNLDDPEVPAQSRD
ncbi:MAG: cupin domain-containing protein [Alphaproteobacteria bacterium]|nr:cupin domain-containing protein [Alphaproteobacteria bacterium]